MNSCLFCTAKVPSDDLRAHLKRRHPGSFDDVCDDQKDAQASLVWPPLISNDDGNEHTQFNHSRKHQRQRHTVDPDPDPGNRMPREQHRVGDAFDISIMRPLLFFEGQRISECESKRAAKRRRLNPKVTASKQRNSDDQDAADADEEGEGEGDAYGGLPYHFHLAAHCEPVLTETCNVIDIKTALRRASDTSNSRLRQTETETARCSPCTLVRSQSPSSAMDLRLSRRDDEWMERLTNTKSRNSRHSSESTNTNSNRRRGPRSRRADRTDRVRVRPITTMPRHRPRDEAEWDALIVADLQRYHFVTDPRLPSSPSPSPAARVRIAQPLLDIAVSVPVPVPALPQLSGLKLFVPQIPATLPMPAMPAMAMCSPRSVSMSNTTTSMTSMDSLTELSLGLRKCEGNPLAKAKDAHVHVPLMLPLLSDEEAPMNAMNGAVPALDYLPAVPELEVTHHDTHHALKGLEGVRGVNCNVQKLRALAQNGHAKGRNANAQSIAAQFQAFQFHRLQQR